jgi:UDP-N-acetylmuramoyl-L-alanyl-D-glutamate--2,6-diaminopimelate ligase
MKKYTVNILKQNDKILEIVGDYEGAITGISIDSRDDMETGWLFFAVSGATSNGHEYIGAVIEKGASVVVCERIPSEIVEGVVYARVESVREVMGGIAAAFYGNPSRNFSVVGVTGTNGKTTIATILYNLYKSMGYTVGLISTMENRINDDVLETIYTTPEAHVLQQLFAQMRDAGCTHCFMEVSSHALSMDRVADIDFEIAIFTNLTQDHLDYHNTMEEYTHEKKKLFDELGDHAVAIVNADDHASQQMVADTAAGVLTYGIDADADYQGEITDFSVQGFEVVVNGAVLKSPLVGKFNVSNILAVYATAVAQLGREKREEIISHLEKTERPRGRFEVVSLENNTTGIVDYAHTPDAMENVIVTAKEVMNNGELWVVFGAGGDRDPGKRPQMGEVAARLADRVIITTDNPRSEDTQKIIDDILAGIPDDLAGNVRVIMDRSEAIKAVKDEANSGDVIMVLGKGHETYQEINGIRHHLDDREELLKE